VFRIRKELRETGKLASPKRPKRGYYKPIDSFDEMVIRNKVHNHRRILPTLNTLLRALREDIKFTKFVCFSKWEDENKIILKTTLKYYVISNICTLNTIKQKGVKKRLLAVFEPYPMLWQALTQTVVLIIYIYHCAFQ